MEKIEYLQLMQRPFDLDDWIDSVNTFDCNRYFYIHNTWLIDIVDVHPRLNSIWLKQVE